MVKLYVQDLKKSIKELELDKELETRLGRLFMEIQC